MESENKKICIIEDDFSIRKLFSVLLKRKGADVIEFDKSYTAKEWLNSNLPIGIIVDIMLPDGNGTELLHYIRQQPNGESVPIIVVTGFAHLNDKQKFLDEGFDFYIPKPVNTLTFADEIFNAIKSKRHFNN